MNGMAKIHLGILSEIDKEGPRTVGELTNALKLGRVPFEVRALRQEGILNNGLVRKGTALMEYDLTDFGRRCWIAAYKNEPQPSNKPVPPIPPLTDKQIAQRTAQSDGMVDMHSAKRAAKVPSGKTRISEIVDAAAAAGCHVSLSVAKPGFNPSSVRLDHSKVIMLDLGLTIGKFPNIISIPFEMIPSVIATLQEHLNA